MPERGAVSVEGIRFVTVAESLLTIQHNTLSVFNIIIKNSGSTVSLIRYPSDLLEFHQKIRKHYPKVKITFPSLNNPPRNHHLQQQQQQQQQHRQSQPQQHQFSSSSLSTSTTTGKTKNRRSLRDFIILPFHKKKKRTNADKVEKYLLQCFQHPVVSLSSILRDFTSVQRDEDAILTSYYTSTTLTPTINNNSSDHQQQPSSQNNKNSHEESSGSLHNNSQLSHIVMTSHEQEKEKETKPQQQMTTTSTAASTIPQHQLNSPSSSTSSLSVLLQDKQYDQRSHSAAVTTVTVNNEIQRLTDTAIKTTTTTAATTDSASIPLGLEDLDLIRVLGKGCMGKVFLARSKKKNNRQLYALKCIKKKWVIQQNEVTHTKAERDILLLLKKQQQQHSSSSSSHGGSTSNSFFAQLNQLFQTSSCLFFLLDYYPGGDLATQLSIFSCFSADRARFYAAEIIQGLQILHQNNIIYRDLKPENVLIGRDGHIVLTDFGLSKLFAGKQEQAVTALDDKDELYYCCDAEELTTRTFCGTAEYLAPEVLIGEPYTFVVDFWSLGTLLYEMLAGTTPFWAEKHMDMYRRVLEEPLTFPPNFDRITRIFLAGVKYIQFRYAIVTTRIIGIGH
ncbi:kinase-like domain-containing protein [Mycotypha africana]|uniref:kinase-like domain-containing protein n=1 Tax=Mycotypha africana TaxID=64632 RepID=UPI0023006965|nr:kinase-like domain-containing protein [Mycotypha africana]KAI8981993.1 kinase-like domain-containing protein [Mycotypha africana]